MLDADAGIAFVLACVWVQCGAIARAEIGNRIRLRASVPSLLSAAATTRSEQNKRRHRRNHTHIAGQFGFDLILGGFEC